jgi:hypothetical protein
MEEQNPISPAIRLVDDHFDAVDARHSTLCMLLLPHRLAYGIYDEEKRKFAAHQAVYLPFDLDSASFLQAVREEIARDELLHLPFQSTLIACDSRPFALLPDSYAQQADLGLFTALQGKLPAAHSLGRDSITAWNAVMEYAQDPDLKAYLERTFSGCQLFHAYTPLLLGLERERPDRGEVCYLMVQRNWLIVVAFRDGELQLFNAYPYRSAEDFVYFCLLVADDLGLDKDKTPFVLLGEVQRESEVYQTLQAYLRQLQFGRRPRGFRYLRSIRTMPGQHFYSLFSLPLCAS